MGDRGWPAKTALDKAMANLPGVFGLPLARVIPGAVNGGVPYEFHARLL